MARYGNAGTINMTGVSILNNGGAMALHEVSPANTFTVNAGSTGLAFNGTVATGAMAAKLTASN